MAELTLSGGVWTPGSHRHHHSGSGGGHFDISHGRTYGFYTADARDPEDGKTFLFWSWSGATETGVSLDHNVGVSFPERDTPATLTRWYEPDGGPGSETGLRFDAFSAESGDFLDWGDDFDPFTATPPGTRDDDFARTATEPVSVSAADVWPHTDLLFDRWLVVRGNADPIGADIRVERGQSAVAFALYAQALTPQRRPIDRIPPYVYFHGDPAPITQELTRLANVNEQAMALNDSAGRAQIRAAVMRYLVELGESHMKELDAEAKL
jgi:hypothetical protein